MSGSVTVKRARYLRLRRNTIYIWKLTSKFQLSRASLSVIGGLIFYRAPNLISRCLMFVLVPSLPPPNLKRNSSRER